MLNIKINFSFPNKFETFKGTKTFQRIKKLGIPSEFILERFDENIDIQELEKKIIQDYVNRTK